MLVVSNIVKKTSKKGKKSLGKDITMDEGNCDVSQVVKGKQKESATLHHQGHCMSNSLDNQNSRSTVVKGKDIVGDTIPHPPAKKFKGPEGSTPQRGPLGLKWDGKNYSCGYDSFFTIIYNIWKDNVAQNLLKCSSLMDLLFKKFANVVQGTLTFEGAQDHVQILLNNFDQLEFPMGKQGVAVTSLVSKLMGSTAFGSVISVCEVCGSVHSLMLKGKHILTLKQMEDVDVASLLGADGSQKLACAICLNLNSVTCTAYLDEILSMIALEANASPALNFV